MRALWAAVGAVGLTLCLAVPARGSVGCWTSKHIFKAESACYRALREIGVSAGASWSTSGEEDAVVRDVQVQIYVRSLDDIGPAIGIVNRYGFRVTAISLLKPGGKVQEVIGLP